MPYLIPVAVTVLAVILAVALFFAVRRKASAGKGEEGEKAVAKLLGKNRKNRQYVFNDLLFLTEAGKSCQIDHVLINRCGIWVIETKNYSGTIYGTEEQREWTQVLARGTVKNSFYNPVMQNGTHVYHLSHYLHVSGVLQNVVVFLDGADLSHVVSDHVCSLSSLPSVLRSNGKCLSAEQMKDIYIRLKELKRHASIGKRQHLRNIRKSQKQLKKGICPRCGKKLVKRTGESGSYYGCSAYPKCKFTKKID